MSTFRIPNSQGQIRQVNNGDTYGELWGTFNVDLTTSPGKIKASKRLTATMSATKMDNDNVQAFALYKGSIVAFASGNRVMYLAAERNPRISGSWASASGSLDIGNESDAVVFDGKLLVSTGTNIASTTDTQPSPSDFDDDWWTAVTSGTALTVNKPHIMDVSKIGQETLFVTDGNLVRYYNTTAFHSAITLSDEHTACCLATDYTGTWFGTYASDGEALIYFLQVGQDQATQAFKVDGTAVLSIEIVKGVPYILTDRGHIQTFDGRGFVTVQSFPFAFKSVVLDGLEVGNFDDSNIDRAIHPKGMRAHNDKLLININTDNQLIDTLASNPLDNDDVFTNYVVDERSPSGVWEYDVNTGVLNHRSALVYDTTTPGYHRNQTSGPILILNNQYTRFLTSGRVETDKTDIFAESPTEVPLSYFITPEIVASTVSEAWERVALKVDTLQVGESVEVKYRTRNNRLLPAYLNMTWLDGTQFTTTNDTSNISVGDEVEIVNGYKAGEIAHITEISSGTTKTITIDTNLGVLNEAGIVRVQNWQKIDYTYNEDTLEFDTVGITETSAWIQFKVVMRGQVTVRQFISKGNSKNEL